MMTPQGLSRFLQTLIKQQLMFSVMIWGAPGIGKSSIVAQTAQESNIDWIDVRLSQLAPTDLRGLPVPDHDQRISRWYPPEFLPKKGKGILFLDELNMAPPTMQGMAQQLILDRRVGSYIVPDGWFIWAAGNRKEDRASVFDMPAPLANRFLHLTVEPDFESFKNYGLVSGTHEQVLAFLSFRPELLHKIDPNKHAWPSPRSWMMASALHGAGLSIAPVVGEAAESEFRSYLDVYHKLPDLDKILNGEGTDISFPREPSTRFATIIALVKRAKDVKMHLNAFRWVVGGAGSEWLHLYGADLMRVLAADKGSLRGVFMAEAKKDARLWQTYLEISEVFERDLTDARK